MKTNNKTINTRPIARTYNGAPAVEFGVNKELRRAVSSCLLWEDSFYESGQDIARRIAGLVAKAKPQDVAALAIEAREQLKLRHVPLLLVREMARNPNHRPYVADTLNRVIQRADELAEFLSIYWKDGKDQAIASSVKKGLAKAFVKFDEYALAKYNRDADVKLRDVMFLCHPRPENKKQEALWKRLVNDELKTPDTWEVQLSAGGNKREVFTSLIQKGELGALALLRNLRNMVEANVDRKVIVDALTNMRTERVLPFRFISAARYAPQFEPQLEAAMFKCLEGVEKLPGNTELLIDISGSMDSPVSSKSDLSRIDAACALAILLREICESVRVYTFSNNTIEVPARRGFALRDAIVKSQPHGGTYLGKALETVKYGKDADRLIVITDEQSSDRVLAPNTQAYMLNVASYQNGVGYGPWNRIDGWSESIVRYISELEKNTIE